MKKKNFNFKIQNRQFFRQNIKNIFLLKIIDDRKKRNEIVKHMHNDSEHQKRKKKRFVELSIDIIEKIYMKKFEHTSKSANAVNLKIFVTKKKFCILFEFRICDRK